MFVTSGQTYGWAKLLCDFKLKQKVKMITARYKS